MTFKHKLSRRLAQAFAGSTLGVAALLACDAPAPTTPPTEPPPEPPPQVVALPRDTTITTQDTVRFRAAHVTAAGDTVDVTASWQANHGAISADGVFTPADTGAWTVIAETADGTDTVLVTVMLPPPPVPASMVVTPDTATRQVGERLVLTADIRDAVRQPLDVAVVWHSETPEIATVTTDGVVTAHAAGSVTIVATSEPVQATATLWVPAPEWAHEPAGLTLLSNEPWNWSIPLPHEALIGGDWRILWNTAGLTTTVRDSTAPYSPDSVVQFLYPLGYISEVHGLGTPYIRLGDRRTVFTGLWWKLSPGWQGHLTGSNKVQYVFTTGYGSITMVAYGPRNGPWEMRVYPQFSTSRGVWLVPNATNVPLVADEWYQVEWFLDADAGIVRWWVNGQLVGDYTGEPFPAAPLTEFKLAPVWGGQGDTKIQTDWVRFDHVYLSGR